MLDNEENVQKPILERLKAGFLFWTLWLIATAIAASVRFKVINVERMNEVVDGGEGGLILPWHGTTILPIYYFRNRGIYSIVSLSKDGELQNKHLESRGFKTIRGSSNRRGARALLGAVKVLRSGGAIAITPDGPKGPIYKVQAGVVHMARHSSCRILPMGVACKPCKYAEKAWDRFMIPLPFSRAVLYLGEYVYVNKEDDDETSIKRIEDAINEANRLAHEALG